MSVTKPLSAPPLATLHIIPHLRWEREGIHTLDSHRHWLLETVARVLELMDGTTIEGVPLRFFLLGGQTIVLEDIAAVRPDLLALLVIYNAGGRLGIGPWYVLADDTLVSGEALIRNLLVARADAIRHGVKLMPIAYAPEHTGHSSQLPQILRGVGITAAFLHYDALPAHEPFRWEGQDGGSLLVVNYPAPDAPAEDARASLTKQKAIRPDGPYLWLIDSEQMALAPDQIIRTLTETVGVQVDQSDLLDYLRSLRRALPDSRRSTIAGELYRPNAGTASARLYLKQHNARLQARLTYLAEPLLALALTHGELRFPENTRATLNYSWRLALQNQTLAALGGAGQDAVHEENEIRARQANDAAAQVITTALEALPGQIHRPRANPSGANPHVATYVMVWNMHNWPVRQVVEVPLRLPAGRFPSRLRSPGAEELAFGWSPDDSAHSGTLAFLADVPAMGYAVYTAELSDNRPDQSHAPRLSSGRAIGSVNGDTLSVEDDGLRWTFDDAAGQRMSIGDLLNFYDSGDAGDVFGYAVPQPDVLVKGMMADDVRVESSPTYERLIFQHRMRIANGLRLDGGRDRGLKALDLTTTATFYDHVPGVFFRTTLTNSARDHRLRVHLRTGMQAVGLLAAGAVGLVPRPLHDAQTMQGGAAVYDAGRTLALLAPGLPEFEPIPDADQTTLALTLLRAVGVLRRQPDPLHPRLAVPGAQCQRAIQADYALLHVTHNDACALLRAVIENEAPLYAVQYDARPERPRRSFLSVVSDRALGADSDGAGAIVTAFKPPQKGKGWVVRLLNPTERPVEVWLTPHVRPDYVHVASLAEETIQALETDGNGRSVVTLDPQQLLTLRFGFV